MFRVELRDRSFNLLEILDNEYIDLEWAYARNGGCGEFGFMLPRRLYEEKSISGDFNIRIYFRDPVTKAYGLRYQGLIENKIPEIRGNSQSIRISGHGYQSQLSRIYLSNSFSNMEISEVAAAIIGTYVDPETDIVFDASLIQTTGFTADQLDFNTDALRAIQTCADTAGNCEWGVGPDLKFFFKQKSTSVGFRYALGANIRNFEENLDFKEIVNRVIIQGAQSGGTYYTATYNDVPSQLKYGVRTKVIQNSAISTDSVGAQFATSTFAEYRDVVRKASCSLVGITAAIEATTPIPLFSVIAKETTYGEKYYGTFLYSGRVNRSVNRIMYKVSNRGSFQVDISLDQLRPHIAEQIAQLEYQLEQQRNASL